MKYSSKKFWFLYKFALRKFQNRIHLYLCVESRKNIKYNNKQFSLCFFLYMYIF